VDTPSDDPIDEIRRIFEITIALGADQREAWLMENVPNSATRHVVKRLLEADGQPGLFDISVIRLLEAICGPGDQASLAARRAP
jgi:hypothetical protein